MDKNQRSSKNSINSTTLEKGSSLIIGWSNHTGFGQVTIAFDRFTGKPFVDTEYMGREFVMEVLEHLVNHTPTEYEWGQTTKSKKEETKPNI